MLGLHSVTDDKARVALTVPCLPLENRGCANVSYLLHYAFLWWVIFVEIGKFGIVGGLNSVSSRESFLAVFAS